MCIFAELLLLVSVKSQRLINLYLLFSWLLSICCQQHYFVRPKELLLCW